MLLHAFPSMCASSLREFQEICVYKHGGLSCFIEYLLFAQKIIKTANFLSDDTENAIKKKKKKRVQLLDLLIKTIHFLFYNYIFVHI